MSYQLLIFHSAQDAGQLTKHVKGDRAVSESRQARHRRHKKKTRIYSIYTFSGKHSHNIFIEITK